MYETLKNRLPEIISDIGEIDEVLKVESKQLQISEDSIFDLIDQAHFQSATWSISRLEDIFNVTGSVDDSLEMRRKRIADKQGTNIVANKNVLVNLVNRYLKNDSAEIELLHDLYHFVISYSLDDLQMFTEVTTMVEKTKPAHLGYTMRSSVYDATTFNEKVVANNRRYRKVREIKWSYPLLFENNEVIL
ncbi:TPA: putative phage tail protein [Listeria monocytogenes]